MRKSLGIRNWEAAQKLVRRWESGESNAPLISVEDACKRYLEDCKGRMRTSSLELEEVVINAIADEFGNRPLRILTPDDVAQFKEKRWGTFSGITVGRRIGRLRGFFNFCIGREWIEKNPVLKLRVKVEPKVTMPLSKEEFEKLLWATEIFPVKGLYGEKNRVRVRAFILLLRYSGIRIRDAVSFSFDKLDGNKLFLYSHKTMVPVRVPLPEFVVKELHNAHDGFSKYVFWSGNGKIKSCVGDWSRTIHRLGKIAGVKFHAHMLRATFAVELLNSGVSLETVATLLGNTIKVAEAHYAPFVKSRQVALEASIEKAWKLD